MNIHYIDRFQARCLRQFALDLLQLPLRDPQRFPETPDFLRYQACLVKFVKGNLGIEAIEKVSPSRHHPG